MKLSDNAMCAVLLCSHLGLKNTNTVKPLSLGEWNSFLNKLIEKNLEPKVIFDIETDLGNLLSYSEEEIKRIRELSSRGGSVALEIDDLNKKGIEVITLFDADYPKMLERILKKKRPPVLFYAGDITLANKVGIAVAGSRDVDDSGIKFAINLAEKAARERLVLYSGGAKGVDTISETATINSGGAAVVYVADSLLARIKKQDTINNIMNKKLLLITDMKPDAGFSTGRAMNRNKFIYASAFGSFVVSATYNKGGTWNGAIEALRNDWGKIFVWNHNEYDGNKKLIEKGAIPYEISEEKLYDIVTKNKTYEQMDLFKTASINKEIKEQNKDTIEEIIKKDKNIVKEVTGDNFDIYNYIKDYIIEHLHYGLNADKAAEQFCVAKGQMKTWLKRLCEEGLAECKKGVYSKAE